MAHPAEQTLANDGVMLTEGRHTALKAPAYLGTKCHCLHPNWGDQGHWGRGCHRVWGREARMRPRRRSVPWGLWGGDAEHGVTHGGTWGGTWGGMRGLCPCL